MFLFHFFFVFFFFFNDTATTEIYTLSLHDALPISLAAPVYDIAFDSKRSALYLSQPQSQQVAVLSTTTMTLQTPIALFGSPSGLDLSVGGDSLVVALKSTQLLAIVNLLTS